VGKKDLDGGHFGWNGGFWLLFGSCLISVGLFAVVWRLEGSRVAGN